GGGGEHICEARDLDDVGRVPSARALRMESMDGAPLDGADRVLDKAALIQRVGVDHHLDVVIVGDPEAAIDRGRRRSPILVELQGAGAAFDLLDDWSWSWRSSAPRFQRIGSCTVTSFVPSGKVASTWTSWIMAATPSMTWLASITFAPSRISSETLLPSRAP